MEMPAEWMTIRPGETLLLRYDRVSREQAELIRAKLGESLPGVRVVVVEAAGWSADEDQVAAEEARIRDMMAEAGAHPGRMVQR